MLNTQIIEKINDYYSYCKAHSVAHKKAAEKYKFLYNCITSPIIILSSVNTLLASYSINTTITVLVTITAVLPGIITIAHALSSFLEYNVKYEAHLKTSNCYMELVLTIENDFLLTYYDDNSEITKDFIMIFFKKIHTILTNIKNNEPCLPSSISNQKYINDYYGLNDISEQLIPKDISINVTNHNNNQNNRNISVLMPQNNQPPPNAPRNDVQMTLI